MKNKKMAKQEIITIGDKLQNWTRFKDYEYYELLGKYIKLLDKYVKEFLKDHKGGL